MSEAKNQQTQLVTDSGLQEFFFASLEDLNRKSLRPVPVEVLHYTSGVLDRMSESEQFFVKENGRYCDDLLGVKLLESGSKCSEEQKRILREVGDKSLLICGMFSPSNKTKIVGRDYYLELGKTAYQRLDNLVPSFYEVRSFFIHFSGYFEVITQMVLKLQSGLGLNRHPNENLVLTIDQKSDDELLALGIVPQKSKSSQ